MHPLIASLIESGPAVTDGSWGTQMHKRGLKRGQSPDSWNLSQPEQVEAVARQYVDAGSQIILTNTFGASRLSLSNYKLGDKVLDINSAGVRISRQAAGDRVRVFASIGPTGRMLVTGETTEAELQNVFEEQAGAQAQAGADGILIETMIDVDEARIAAQAAKQTGLPVIVSMVFDSGEDKDRTMMGNSPEEFAVEMHKIGVDGLGANCGQGIEAFLPICKRLRQATDLPIWMKPNAGLPEVVDDSVVFRTTPAEFVRYVADLVRAGANFIGGCCGTDQEFVKAIRQAVVEFIK
jgi:5-methyltetrahydrofolate--homocysteine methyltransferase